MTHWIDVRDQLPTGSEHVLITGPYHACSIIAYLTPNGTLSHPKGGPKVWRNTVNYKDLAQTEITHWARIEEKQFVYEATELTRDLKKLCPSGTLVCMNGPGTELIFRTGVREETDGRLIAT